MASWKVPSELLIQADTIEEATRLASMTSGSLSGRCRNADRPGRAFLLLKGEPVKFAEDSDDTEVYAWFDWRGDIVEEPPDPDGEMERLVRANPVP